MWLSLTPTRQCTHSQCRVQSQVWRTLRLECARVCVCVVYVVYVSGVRVVYVCACSARWCVVLPRLRRRLMI